MKKHQNIFKGDTVKITSTATIEGRPVVNYVKEDNKQRSETGTVIKEHTKWKYVFDATYKEVRV